MVEINQNEAEAEGPEKLGWDGKPLLTEEELARQAYLFKDMIDDLEQWEATFTAEENEAQEAYEASLRVPAEEGGDAAREQF